MEKKNDYNKIIRAFAWITQLGLNMVTPIILCIFIGSYIQRKFQLGNTVMLISILLGIGGSFMSLVNFIRTVGKEERERTKKNAE